MRHWLLTLVILAIQVQCFAGLRPNPCAFLFGNDSTLSGGVPSYQQQYANQLNETLRRLQTQHPDIRQLIVRPRNPEHFQNEYEHLIVVEAERSNGERDVIAEIAFDLGNGNTALSYNVDVEESFRGAQLSHLLMLYIMKEYTGISRVPTSLLATNQAAFLVQMAAEPENPQQFRDLTVRAQTTPAFEEQLRRTFTDEFLALRTRRQVIAFRSRIVEAIANSPAGRTMAQIGMDRITDIEISVHQEYPYIDIHAVFERPLASSSPTPINLLNFISTPARRTTLNGDGSRSSANIRNQSEE